MEPSIELRFMGAAERLKLASILDSGDSWKTLASVIEKPGSSDGELLITSSSMRILEEQKSFPGRSPTQVLFDYWATTGRRNERPTLATLVQYLKSCDLLRAAEFVEQEVMQSSTKTEVAKKLPKNLKQFSYSQIGEWTNNFDQTPLMAGGHKIGEGAFGAVFRCVSPENRVLAIKVLNDEFREQFLNEVDVMTQISHENILPLVGISLEDHHLCLVMDFMTKGSLLVALANSKNVLSVQHRVNIALGTAKGLNHLHTGLSKPLVHRDVKSDNILLDEYLVPKVADFGLARIGSSASGMTSTRHVTQNVIGTSVYMSPEAFRGDVSVKLDTFAFGVVLLELVTALKPYDESREEPDILSHVEELIESSAGDFDSLIAGNNLKVIVDQRIDDWPLSIAKSLLSLSRLATEQRKKNRPTMDKVLQSLISISNDLNTK